VGINISKVLNCKNVLKMLVIGPHSLNTLQARVIDMKLYCDDVMGGSTIEIINNTRGCIEFKNWERS
jgi:hypothetical protein